MPNVEKQRERLISLLKELFQLDQPDLDFGFYRIMHAKAGRVTKFLEEDLLSIIRDAFGEADGARVEQAKAAHEAARQQAIEYGAPDPDVTEPVKKAKAAWDAAKESGSNEGDVYDHLYRFFERYYDNGDFMSRRYFARETDGKAAPYAVPYDGREVYLHWANRDQYYIKTSEYLTNFTFDPTQAKEFKDKHGALFEQKPLKVHCRIVSASEGEHNNVKASEQTERYFIIHEPEPVKIEMGDTGEPELVIQFQYRPDPEKTGQDGTWRKKRLAEAADKVKALLPKLEGANDYVTALTTPAPTEAEKDRTLLEKYLAQYTGRNTMDYFIHKDLGGFLRRELDFYIKNEVMRLDDIESADAPRVEAYLAKVKVLRRIAQHLIDFLAQLEDFQKRLWLKKKFVVDTQYCITLDRIPEEFYPEIAANEAQRKEWVKLFAIDQMQGYSEPLSVDFLRENQKLLLDTCFLTAETKEDILARLQDIDAEQSGQLVHSDNFQALRLFEEKLRDSVKCIYIDPPYNTDSSSIPYKNSYKHSSWATLMHDRLRAMKPMLPKNGAIFVSIDKSERTVLEHAMDAVFGAENRVEELIWSMNTNNSQVPNYSTNHEYVLVYAKDKPTAEKDRSMFREPKPGYLEVMELVAALNPDYPPISEIEEAIKKLYNDHKIAYREEIEAQGLEWEDFQKDDPWKGLFNYKNAEYRDADGKIVDESVARELQAQIWVFRESDLALPATKQAASTRDPKSPNYRFYTANHPITGKPVTMPKSGWKFPYDRAEDDTNRTTLKTLDEDGRIAWGDTEAKVPQIKRMLHEVETNVGKSIFVDYSDGEKQTSAMFGQSGIFLAPKHADFVSRFITHAAEKDSTILDCFGGSASTGHAVLSLNRADHGSRKFCLVEMGEYFDTVTRPRMQKAIYASQWRDGKPLSNDGLSALFKYVRLESYEDALNNLTLLPGAGFKGAKGDFERDYMLRYWLDFETKGSPSLLNIEWFDDPTAYKLKIKKPGTDEYVEKAVDLVETFNWLTGLHVEHLDRWRGYDAAFKREVDPELPGDTNTRLMLDGALKETDDGTWRFRKVEGYTLRTPGDHNDREKALVVWRKLTGDLEQDNLMLDEWFRKYRLSAQDTEFDVIYVNGSNNLPNLRKDEETWKVRLIEEAFHQAMWDVEG
ncbi:site-specific DNA-methyltransferase [Tropicibacter naphthalenivorans]|uniref:site-specific DNA-methyltransferase (adenine-specific) n=1 Tax=Tropicibacter naphthalenivorans TaxID=441103 RepID=A0A0P1GHP5_9RHOB|nr:site-specific DNA-methyltransferase [Tropicibacter naphthalenivorans]CUH81511.1 putative methyltransferase [Tropicibacter naphthalenivorans]SMD00068.1 DNA methylase [Tropicibacter naphthalenivorans]